MRWIGIYTHTLRRDGDLLLSPPSCLLPRGGKARSFNSVSLPAPIEPDLPRLADGLRIATVSEMSPSQFRQPRRTGVASGEISGPIGRE